jgi:hypothetical protein
MKLVKRIGARVAERKIVRGSPHDYLMTSSAIEKVSLGKVSHTGKVTLHSDVTPEFYKAVIEMFAGFQTEIKDAKRGKTYVVKVSEIAAKE